MLIYYCCRKFFFPQTIRHRRKLPRRVTRNLLISQLPIQHRDSLSVIMNTITYQRATSSDAKTLADYRVMFALELKGDQPQDAIRNLTLQLQEYFTRAIGNNSCIAYIAREGNEVAGIGSIMIREQPGNFLNPSGRVGYVMNMYTVKAFRRKGVCTGILNAMLNDAAALGITAFELHATKAGEEVYKKNGFRIHTEPTYRKYIPS